jgi:GR25 family glycosyltransferase involved in LPS biosynthesis
MISTIKDIKDLPTYCINLEKRTDRWTMIQSQPGFEEFKHMQRFIGVDGSKIDIMKDDRITFLTKRNIVKKTRRAHEELSTKGGVGCYLSHVQLWQKFLNESHAPAMLVFEDDVKLTEDSYKNLQTQLLSSPTLQNTNAYDFCILSPSSNPRYTSRSVEFKGEKGLDRLNNFTCLVSYIITRKGVEKILPLVFPIESHIDGFISACSSMNVLDVCAPKKSMFKYITTKSDIYDNGGCEICNIPTNFTKDKVIIPKTEYYRYKAEETLIIGVLGLAMINYFMKKKK